MRYRLYQGVIDHTKLIYTTLEQKLLHTSLNTHSYCRGYINDRLLAKKSLVFLVCLLHSISCVAGALLRNSLLKSKYCSNVLQECILCCSHRHKMKDVAYIIYIYSHSFLEQGLITVLHVF